MSLEDELRRHKLMQEAAAHAAANKPIDVTVQQEWLLRQAQFDEQARLFREFAARCDQAIRPSLAAVNLVYANNQGEITHAQSSGLELSDDRKGVNSPRPSSGFGHGRNFSIESFNKRVIQYFEITLVWDRSHNGENKLSFRVWRNQRVQGHHYMGLIKDSSVIEAVFPARQFRINGVFKSSPLTLDDPNWKGILDAYIVEVIDKTRIWFSD